MEKNVVKIPIRSLEEYKIRYNYDKTKHVGQGDGESNVGDVIARDGSKVVKWPGKGKTQEMNQELIIMKQKYRLRKLKMLLFKELELPNLKQKKNKMKL